MVSLLVLACGEPSRRINSTLVASGIVKNSKCQVSIDAAPSFGQEIRPQEKVRLTFELVALFVLRNGVFLRLSFADCHGLTKTIHRMPSYFEGDK